MLGLRGVSHLQGMEAPGYSTNQTNRWACLLSHVLAWDTLAALSVCVWVRGNNGPVVCPSTAAAVVALHLCFAVLSMHPPTPTLSTPYASATHSIHFSSHFTSCISAALQRTMHIQQACNGACGPWSWCFISNLKRNDIKGSLISQLHPPNHPSPHPAHPIITCTHIFF